MESSDGRNIALQKRKRNVRQCLHLFEREGKKLLAHYQAKNTK
ncbi:hypothetical protein NQ318_012949 [Aromia moschata]|uniref:Uncharacterized protein n=1 Tax=Aromia moschata TaxID=1265417 RepID=A0AAV8XRD4_9CUCU|nr:hypothetical protein NQ318_012949 [Aromia moschata]